MTGAVAGRRGPRGTTAIPGATDAQPTSARFAPRLVDGSELDEFKARYGTTLVCGFAHIEGMPVGIVANNGILFPKAPEGRALHRTLLPAQDPARLPAEHHRLHGRPQATRTRHRPRGAKMVTAVACSGAQAHGDRRRQLWRRQLRHVRPRLFARFLWMWPNARISVMGGEQAASVLATVSA